MNKIRQEIYDLAIAYVSEYCNVTKTELLMGKHRDACESRYVLVMVMSQYMSDTDIATLLHITRQGVCAIRNNSTKSRDWVLSATQKQITSKIKNAIES
jgi:hypothetical protein